MVLILVAVMVVLMAASLNHYSFQMASGSEEAGIAFRGFPFPILKSETVFYAGYVGQLANEGGSAYIRHEVGKNDKYRLLFPGLAADIAIYAMIAGLILLLDSYRRHLTSSATSGSKI